ncbi:MAG: DUF3892 domain-containing protein [Candidatus Cybelea sp.]
MPYYVVCITKKPYHQDPYTSIQAYGVVSDVQQNYATERWTQSQMIEKLESGTIVKTYGTNPRTGKREYVELEVITRADKSKYVKTVNDGDKPDNLLEQRECGSSDA